MNRSVSASAERALPCLNSNNCIDVKNTNVIKEKQKPANIEKFLPNECKTRIQRIFHLTQEIRRRP